MRKAIIIGSNGQDGRLLFSYLKKKKYGIIGIDRNSTVKYNNKWKENVDITNKEQVFNLIKKIKPDEIYYLAAHHHSSQDNEGDSIGLINNSYEINVLSFGLFLEAIKHHSSMSRIFYASSSLIFGDASTKKQSETTPFNPNTVYGITKLSGMLLGRIYREKFGLFVASGIFYNHESFYRADKFISKKIVSTAVDISNGIKTELIIGDLSATVDWGYAPDYVEAAHKILQAKKPDEFIIATGKIHTVMEFAELTFKQLNLDWKKYTKENGAVLSRRRGLLIGDNRKIFKIIKWQPKTDFKQMIKIMVAQELKHKNGK